MHQRRGTRTRLNHIVQRASYLQGNFIGADPGSLARELTDEERKEAVTIGQQAGALWAARHRGLL